AASDVYKRQVQAKPVQCGSCHTGAASSYNESVHSETIAEAGRVRATCGDCHGYHSVLPRTSPGSTVHFAQLIHTCGRCHAAIAQEVQTSVHGRALAQGHREAPSCTDCHPGHAVTGTPERSALRISLGICGRCHASETVNTRFGLPKDRVVTFFESYHGLASHYGQARVAHCGSCHGNHLVLPQSDPRSAVHPDRLPETCGKCHPGAGPRFAAGKVHLDLCGPLRSADTGTMINRAVRKLYIGLIIFCIGFMAGHNLITHLRKTLVRRESIARPVLRMNKTQRCQHLLLVVSFTVLVVSGFALRWPESWISWVMLDNELVRRWTHRCAGLVLIGTAFWHMAYVMLTAEGRRLIRDFVPRRKDFGDAVLPFKWGQYRHAPGVGDHRFGYVEKIEYWAVVWGVTVMVLTGLALWFKVEVTRIVPRWVVDVAATIHFYEAVLATLAVIVWHLYHVIFGPDVYPMNWAWLDGYTTGRTTGVQDSNQNPASSSQQGAGQSPHQKV
ncbi:MAG: cytochrome b/b6 domain-containing protein, partial [Verrucomicrobiae bacterium]|nr:cytochrome b/b6 domain-containing protein [Verrucomicrobiae bacterium]